MVLRLKEDPTILIKKLLKMPSLLTQLDPIIA